MQHFPEPGTPRSDRRDWYNIRNMLPFIWKYRGRALIALACLVLAKVANVGVPLVLKQLVDFLENVEHGAVLMPVTLLLAYGLLKLAASAFNELRDGLFARVRYHAMREVSTSLLRHLYRLSLRFHLERKTGAISRDLERGTRSISSILNYMVFSIIPMFIEFGLVAAILLAQYPLVFTLVTFGTVIVYIAFTFAISEWRMEFRHSMNKLDSQANSEAMDGLINYESVKYFGNEALEYERFDKTLTSWEEAAVKSQTSMSVLNFGQGAIIAIGVTVIMFLATNEVAHGDMTLGDLVLVNAFLLQLFIPLNFLGIVYRQIKYSLADMDRVIRLMETEPEITDRPNAVVLDSGNGDVRFEQVDFSYSENRQVLFGVDFELQAGKQLAIVGASGSGKSTIARLLYRFYDVSAGRILFDGYDIRDITQRSLRRGIGIVPQDTALFNESILFNLQYGQPDASFEEIQQAAKMAHIHEFIVSLPEQYDTIVGERGLKLSGGEKQRIAIARAILKRPQLLVFDEATSSLDSRTEQSIQQTLGEISRNVTTLVIAHRLSTIVHADEILVMDKGRIIERGTHQSLLDADGYYAHMWLLQQKARSDKRLQGEDS